jgi:hypothetical protein
LCGGKVNGVTDYEGQIRFGFLSEYDNSSVGEEERFASRHVWAAFKDWQVRYQLF